MYSLQRIAALLVLALPCTHVFAAEVKAVPVKIVEATYSDEAKRAKYKADVFLTVTVDKQGHPRNPRMVRPVGLGLDERVLKAIQFWEFRPATRNGIPISTQVLIEVSFRPGEKTKSKIASKDDLPIEYGDR